MPRSYQIFSLGILMILTTSISAIIYRGNILHRKKEALTFSDPPMLIKHKTFSEVETRALPHFKHVVINFPNHNVLIHQSNQFNGLKFKSKIPAISLEDFVNYQLRTDTLFVSGKIDMSDFEILTQDGEEVHSYDGEPGMVATSPQLLVHISIQGSEIESITLLDKSRGEFFMQYEHYPDSNWMKSARIKEDILATNFQKQKLSLKVHNDTHYFLQANIKDLDIDYLVNTSSWNLGAITGKYQSLAFSNPSGQMARSMALVDSLHLSGVPGLKLRDRWEFTIKDYLNMDLDPKSNFHLAYKKFDTPIYIDGKVSKYQLVHETE